MRKRMRWHTGPATAWQQAASSVRPRATYAVAYEVSYTTHQAYAVAYEVAYTTYVVAYEVAYAT